MKAFMLALTLLATSGASVMAEGFEHLYQTNQGR